MDMKIDKEYKKKIDVQEVLNRLNHNKIRIINKLVLGLSDEDIINTSSVINPETQEIIYQLTQEELNNIKEDEELSQLVTELSKGMSNKEIRKAKLSVVANKLVDSILETPVEELMLMKLKDRSDVAKTMLDLLQKEEDKESSVDNNDITKAIQMKLKQVGTAKFKKTHQLPDMNQSVLTDDILDIEIIEDK